MCETYTLDTVGLNFFNIGDVNTEVCPITIRYYAKDYKKKNCGIVHIVNRVRQAVTWYPSYMQIMQHIINELKCKRLIAIDAFEYLKANADKMKQLCANNELQLPDSGKCADIFTAVERTRIVRKKLTYDDAFSSTANSKAVFNSASIELRVPTDIYNDERLMEQFDWNELYRNT